MKKCIFLGLLTAIPSMWLGCAPGGSGSAPVSFGAGGGTSQTGSPVYVTNTNNGSVSAYQLNPTSGLLQRTSSSPVSTGGSSPDSIVTDATKKFLLIANSASASTAVFSMDPSTAALTPVAGSPFAAAGNEIRLAVHPNDKFVYALTSTPAQILGYNFDSSTGALSPLSGFPVSLNASGEMGLAISPNGGFLYTSNPNTNLITSFVITSSGALTPLATTTPVNGSPVFLNFDGTGNVLFATNIGGPLGGGSVSEFNVSLSGALTEAAGSPVLAGTTPVGAAFSHGVLYVVNQTSATVSAFALNNTSGQLTEIKGSPYAVGTRPAFASAAVNGTFLLVSNSASGNGGSISVFSIASDGTLTPVSGSPFPTDTPVPDQILGF
jgi:6-phosphogluconolactonase